MLASLAMLNETFSVIFKHCVAEIRNFCLVFLSIFLLSSLGRIIVLIILQKAKGALESQETIDADAKLLLVYTHGSLRPNVAGHNANA